MAGFDNKLVERVIGGDELQAAGPVIAYVLFHILRGFYARCCVPTVYVTRALTNRCCLHREDAALVNMKFNS